MKHTLNTSLGRMLSPRLVAVLMVVAGLLLSPAYAAQSWDLPEAFPANVEHGLQLMRDPQLQQAMQAYNAAALADPSSYLLILHGKADSEEARAMQLADWLVLLGMQQENIRFKRSRKLQNQLRLQIDSP